MKTASVIGDDATKSSAPIYFIRLPTVLNRLGVSRSTFYAGVRASKFPAPIHIGRSAVWTSIDIDALVNAICEGLL